VHFAPACAHADAPAYVAQFDVGLIPYRVKAYTCGLSPLKLYEYLALEKPVVATGLPYLRREAGQIAIAADAGEFAAAVSAALAAPASAEQRTRRRAAAARFSWEAQVDAVETQLAPLLEPQP
jgi:glycosyltransferase involved in cell wall biosynthesis